MKNLSLVISSTYNKSRTTRLARRIRVVKNYHEDDSQDFVILLQAGASAGELFERAKRASFRGALANKPPAKV